MVSGGVLLAVVACAAAPPSQPAPLPRHAGRIDVGRPQDQGIRLRAPCYCFERPAADRGHFYFWASSGDGGDDDLLLNVALYSGTQTSPVDAQPPTVTLRRETTRVSFDAGPLGKALTYRIVLTAVSGSQSSVILDEQCVEDQCHDP